MNQSGCQNSIQSFLNPKPFYGGYNSNQGNFQSVQPNMPINKINRPNMPVSQSNNNMVSRNMNNVTSAGVNKSMSFSESVMDSFDTK